MIDLFEGIPADVVDETLMTIRNNLGKVELYGGHTVRKHADIQVLALKERIRQEDIKYATSYWDVRTGGSGY